jgi:hypothetical protein
VAIAVIFGIGFTVTVTVKVFPEQLPEIGVRVYVAVCDVFVGLISVSLTASAELPASPPVMPPVTTGAGQL